MSQDLSDVTVRARKLSLENLMDSVIKHAPKSYVEPQLYAVTERTLLYKPGDTLFRADIPAYFVKGKDFIYRLRRDTTEKVLVEDRLPADAHQRVMNFSAFPELTNLLTYLENIASASVSQRGFYATSGWGDSLRYHVIVPQKFKRDFMPRCSQPRWMKTPFWVFLITPFGVRAGCWKKAVGNPLRLRATWCSVSGKVSRIARRIR